MGEQLLDPTRTPDLDTIKGWFHASDRRLFEWVLTRQNEAGVLGDLVELGSYLGKSAVLIGRFVRPGETFTVLDLFEGEAGDEDNSGEVARSYATLTEQAFRENYRRFHAEEPVVVKATSDHITEHVAPATVRFFHIDASHLYEHVAGDTDSARALLAPDGLVVFDDFRAEHTPGVAAAVWEAVFTKGLRVIAVTESKLYGTWGDPQPWRDALVEWLDADPYAFWEWHTINGDRIIRCKVTMPPETAMPSAGLAAQMAQEKAAGDAAAAEKASSDSAAESSPRPAAPARSGRSLPRRLAKDWLPPAVHHAVSRRLNPPA